MRMNDENKVRMTLRLSEETNERLEQYAKANKMTKAGGIRQLLELALFADSVLRMETDSDDPLYEVVVNAQELAVKQLTSSTDVAKDNLQTLTPKEQEELMLEIHKLRTSTDSYVFNLNKIGSNINQVTKKYNAVGDLDCQALVNDLITINENLRGMKGYVEHMVRKVDTLWHTVQ